MAALQVAQAAISASAGGSTSRPLLDEGEGERRMTLSERFNKWLCANPFQNIPIVLLFSVGVLCIVFTGLRSSVAVALLGFAALSFGGYQVWALRNLKAEVDQFSKENARLEETEERLEGQVGVLETQKEKLTSQVDKLEDTVVDMKQASDGLEKELEGFEKLKDNFQKFAAETGHDISKVLDNANKIFDKMQSNTVNNEKALLGKIAQDMEFVDRDAGMSKEEFEKFLARIPDKLRKKYTAMGYTYADIAGQDGTIDFHEIDALINKLVEDNNQKLRGIEVH